MAGQHIEREARYEKTGLTTAQRDELILKWTAASWSQREIARRLGITQPAVCLALKRLSGKTRNRARYFCDDCELEFTQAELVNGLCVSCEGL